MTVSVKRLAVHNNLPARAARILALIRCTAKFFIIIRYTV